MLTSAASATDCPKVIVGLLAVRITCELASLTTWVKSVELAPVMFAVVGSTAWISWLPTPSLSGGPPGTTVLGTTSNVASPAASV